MPAFFCCIDLIENENMNEIHFSLFKYEFFRYNEGV